MNRYFLYRIVLAIWSLMKKSDDAICNQTFLVASLINRLFVRTLVDSIPIPNRVITTTLALTAFHTPR